MFELLLNVNLVECLQARSWCQSLLCLEYWLVRVCKDSLNDDVMVVEESNSRATYKRFNTRHSQVKLYLNNGPIRFLKRYIHYSTVQCCNQGQASQGMASIEDKSIYPNKTVK